MGEEKRQSRCRCKCNPFATPKFFLCLLLMFLLSFFPTLSSSHQTFDYKDALSKSLLYFEAQRSGRLPYNQRVRWRHHSGLTDGLEQGVDLVGGYYDAGDNVKFGLPMAFTITMLSWSVIESRRELVAAGELRYALEAIKWGTDYFIKAHTQPNVLWAQVGDGDTDHLCWQRPEDMTTSRRAYRLDERNPGSEVAAETAAAMAAASIVFRTTNPHYSHLLLEHAQQLLEFGDKYRGKYDESVEGAKGYYTSVSGYMDELLWAALWLHRATDDSGYLDYVIANARSFGGITWPMTEFSWDVKYAGVQVMASMIPLEGKNENQRKILKEYRVKADFYICACINKSNSTNASPVCQGSMPLGQRALDCKWNNMQYVSSAVFLLTFYSDHLRATGQTVACDRGLVGPGEIVAFVESQVEYILGANPMGLSYLVGYGEVYPTRVHHRGASMESYRESRVFIGCGQGYDNWYGRKDPNPNLLVGALVGGPDGTDGFVDKRGNFMQTEACTYNTSPLVGVFAKLNALQRESSTVSSI